jgi:hypothetical protein
MASDGPFSYQGQDTESATEPEHDDAGSDDDMTESEIEDDYLDSIAYLLDSRLRSVLGNSELAAHLIPRIQAQVLSEFTPEDVEYGAIMPEDSPGTAQGSDGMDSSLSTSADASSPNDSRQRKRCRKRDQSEERKGNGSSRQYGRMPNPSPEPDLRFACHFYKRDPGSCWPRPDKKYRVCTGPGFRQWRHIK